MKIPSAITGFLSLLLLLAGTASAQTPSANAPPIKMGLWQEEVTTTITGILGVAPAPRKDVVQSCISPESWKNYGLQAANANRCTMSNLHQDSKKMSYDESCGSQQHGVIVLHMDILIDNSTHMHGTAVAKISATSSPHAGTWSSTLNDRFISPDCGNLKPGQKNPLKQ